MDRDHYLVFGDLHGRILPAFRLACAWSRDHGTLVRGLLQVGDLGYFPDDARLDKATRRHAEKDPLEFGAQLIAAPSNQADAIFAEPECPEGLWFTTGNHEDYDALEVWSHGPDAGMNEFPVDVYLRVFCIRDGCVTTLPGGLRTAALWGIDGEAPRARRKYPPRAYIHARSATQLAGSTFQVLLCHDSPRDAVFEDSGSEDLTALLHLARPRFLFFGHYSEWRGEIAGDWGTTRVFHMAGLELRGPGGTAEEGSVGLLTWDGEVAEFAYLDPRWLQTFTRHNWAHR